ncbi:MAG: helix-turn-helix domain-containing protein [Clostridia bacterium]|nr:helix-turn-helix domain-containing protein [Clostridia bacterium]
MPYVFSAAVDKNQLHIRVAPNIIQQGSLVDERPHKHFFIEFHYVYQGEETLFFPTEEKRITLSAGMIAMIPQGVYHCAETAPDGKVTRLCFNFSIDPEGMRDNPIYLIFQNAGQALIFQDPWICGAMERCKSVLEDEADPIQETREGVILLDVILELFRRLSKGMGLHRRTGERELRQKWLIEEHIWTRYHAPDGLKGLAEKMFLSQRQTRKLVKQFYGEDYKTLIVRQRMEMAQIYLQSHTLSLEEVGEKIGYRSYSGFHLAFVRTFGMTPGEYRDRHKVK